MATIQLTQFKQRTTYKVFQSIKLSWI